MNCDGVFDRAAEFLDGTLDASDRSAVADHLASCDGCRGLIAALREAGPEEPGLTDAILARTTGPVCETARERLCALVDATLDPTDAPSLSGHLARCADCASLFRTLSALHTELPLLAAGDPDPDLVAAVLARTSSKPRRAPAGEGRLWWLPRLLDRPRIALEGAFVASVMLVIPIGAVHRQAVSEPATALVAIRDTAGAATASFSVRARAAWAAARGFVAGHAAETAAGIERATGTFSPAGASSQPSDTTAERNEENRR
jgi:anti-sigma factor RsiW